MKSGPPAPRLLPFFALSFGPLNGRTTLSREGTVVEVLTEDIATSPQRSGDITT